MHRIYIHVKLFQKKRTTLEALFHDDDGEADVDKERHRPHEDAPPESKHWKSWRGHRDGQEGRKYTAGTLPILKM